MTDQPEYTPEQYEAARSQVAGGQDAGQPLTAPDDQLGAQVAAGQAAAGVSMGATDVDVSQLLAAIQQMQARVETLEEEKRAQHAPALVGTAESLRDLLKLHSAGDPAHADVLRHAEDLVDAANNTVKSGDTGPVTAIAAKIEKWLRRNHPGPGENAYYRQALDFAGPHLEDAVDSFEPPQRSAAPALGSSRPPARVVQGNVTG